MKAHLLCLGVVLTAVCVMTSAAGERVVLPNGMTLTAVESGASDVCGVHVSLSIGPERVPPDRAGLRALVQQLVYGRMKASIAERPDLFALRLESSQGATLVAETQWDVVDFSATVTSRNLPTLLPLVRDGIFDASWSDDDVVNAKELMASQEETEWGLGDVSGQVLHLFQKAVLPDPQLAQPTFGTETTRQNITLADVRSFYESFYVPNLATVSVVGPFPVNETLALLRKTFGDLATREVVRAAERSRACPLPRSRLQVGLSPETDAAFMVIGFPLPAAGTPEAVLADVAHAALSGPEGLLAKARPFDAGYGLAERFGLRHPPAVEVLPIEISREPYLMIVARSVPATVEDARKSILEGVQTLAQEPLTEAALARAKARCLNLRALSAIQPEYVAKEADRLAMLGAPGPDPAAYARRVSQVTAEELQQFAAKYLTHHAIGLLMPGR